PASITDPVSFIALAFPNGWILAGFAAILGMSVLLVAANAGIIGSSRISYAMSRDGVIPKAFGRLHKKRNTPFISIIAFSSVSVALALSGELSFVSELYNFGALIAYVIVGLSLISLKNKENDVLRPFKTPVIHSIRPFWKRNTNEASASYERYTI